MTRFSPPLFAPLMMLVIAATALSGCAGVGFGSPKPDLKDKLGVQDAQTASKTAPKMTAQDDVDGNLRQAQLLRVAGHYDEAIHILSQLMLVAPDNARVVAEYGKSLAQKGRANDATQFLRRAIELSPNDWTLYSALGVSYDQLSDAVNARAAYEHALALKPNEPSVLNNYALSRMLAKDPESARMLIARAQEQTSAVGDPKIARNVALINQMLPAPAQADAKPVAVATASPESTPAAPKPAPAPAAAKSATAAPRQIANAAPMPAPAASGPRDAHDIANLLASQPLPAAAPVQQAPQQTAMPQVAAQAASGVVMQAVPYDPYAGPAKSKVAAKAKPQPKAVAKAESTPNTDKATAQKASATAKADAVPTLRLAADRY